MCFAGWDDVGDFSSLADLLPAEANQPRILGDPHLGRFVTMLTTPNTDNFLISTYRTSRRRYRRSRLGTSHHMLRC
jgi:mannose-1-phosphate guanylyltransferase